VSLPIAGKGETLMKFRHKLLAAAVCALPCLLSQDAPLTKDAVIQMVKSGLPDEVIIAKIHSQAAQAKFSIDDLISLKTAGASDGVLKAAAGSTGSSAAPAKTGGDSSPAAAGDPDDPMAPHDPGIYMLSLDRQTNKKRMVLIERAGSGHAKTADTWGHAFTMGIVKAKAKTEIPGARAAIRTRDSKPEIYMYFPPTGTLGATDTISSPGQFSLVKLEYKGDHRETTVFKLGFGSASAGADEKKTFKFNFEKIRPYVYKVGPDGSLQSGDYAFIAGTGMAGANSNSSVVVFDFGVDVD
jgi:hypothetical protein